MKKALNGKLPGYVLNAVLLALLLGGFALYQNAMVAAGDKPFRLKIAPSVWQCCYLVLLATSLNLVLGFLGQLSIAQCGFMGVGAYTAALVSLALQRAGFYSDTSGWQFVAAVILSFAAAGALSALIGLLVGIPALRLKGDYLAIITLGFGMIIVNIINNLPFAGQNGLAEGSASSSLYKTGLGFSSKQQAAFLFLAIGVTVVALVMMFMFIRSKYGRAIRAIREDEIAADASGINVSRYKILTFVYSAFFAGIAGALYACCNSALATSTFAFSNSSILNSTFAVVMVVLGGMGSLTGSIVAALGMFFLNYEIKNGALVEYMPGFLQNVFQFPMLVYSIVLVIVIIFRPRGLFGHYEFSPIALWNRLRHGRIAQTKEAEDA